MADLVLTADQLNYVGQPLKDLVVKLRQDFHNISTGLTGRGYGNEIGDNTTISRIFNLDQYRNLVDNLSNEDLIAERDKMVKQLNKLRIVGEGPDPILSIKEKIRNNIGRINYFKGQIISNGDEYKINKLNQVLSHYQDEQFEHEMNWSRLITIRTNTVNALHEILHIMVDPVPVGPVPVGGSINRKTKRRKTKRRKTRRRKTKGRKTKRKMI